MMEKFTIESHHPFVFLPFHKNRSSLTANALLMNCTGTGHELDFPTPLAETHAPVQIFTMQKIALIKETDIQHCVTPYQHTGAGNGFRLHGTIRQWLLMQQEIGEEPGISFTKSIQAKGANERPPWRRYGTPPPCLFCPIWVEHQRS